MDFTAPDRFRVVSKPGTHTAPEPPVLTEAGFVGLCHANSVEKSNKTTQ